MEKLLEKPMEKPWKNLFRASSLFLPPFLRSSSFFFLLRFYHNFTTAFTTPRSFPHLYHRLYHNLYHSLGFSHSSDKGMRREENASIFSRFVSSLFLKKPKCFGF